MNINLVQVLLMLHMVGAICVGLLIISSFISLTKRQISSYKPLAINIALGACFQLITGSFLALSYQSSESILSFCGKVGIYLFFVLFTEALLFKQLFASRLFPAKLVATSLTVGLVFVLITIINL